MRMNTQRILAALLSLVLLLALAPAGWAEEGGEGGGDMGAGGDAPVVSASMPATGVNLDPGANTVNINLAPSDKGTAFAADVVNAKVVADLYLIASAEKDDKYDTYHYATNFPPVIGTDMEEFIKRLADDPDPANQNKQETMLKEFSEMAQRFAKAVLTNDALSTDKYPTVSAAKPSGNSPTITVTGLDAGLYLLILRGEDLKKTTDEDGYITTMTKEGGGQYQEYAYTGDNVITVTRAMSDSHEFLFEPQLITVPTKVVYDSENNPVQQYNTAYGEWTNVLNIVAKPDWKPRYGNLKITKTLTNFADLSKKGDYFEPMTFSFSVVGVDENGETIYEKEVALSVTSPVSEAEVATLHDIPVGTSVTVTETYSGAHASGQTDPQTVIIKAPTMTNENGTTTTVTSNVSFTNTNNDTHRGGHGIENKFTFNKKDGWGWVANGGEGATSGNEVEKQ